LLSLVMGWGVWVPDTRAEGSQKTVVMLVSGDPPLGRRLRQEIEGLGLVAKWLSPEGVRLPSLDDEAITAGAVASIRVAPAGGGDVEMAIFDPITRKTTSWKVVAATTSDPAEGELLATRFVELLRASLLEMSARRPVAQEAGPTS
jgi:hypothetical protein